MSEKVRKSGTQAPSTNGYSQKFPKIGYTEWYMNYRAELEGTSRWLLNESKYFRGPKNKTRAYVIKASYGPDQILYKGSLNAYLSFRIVKYYFVCKNIKPLSVKITFLIFV